LRRIPLVAVAVAIFPLVVLMQAANPAVTLSLSSGLGARGQLVLLNLSVASVAGQQPASLEWQFSYPPADLAFVDAGEGSSAVAAGKTITCSGVSGSYTCIAAGLNKNAIPDGVLATLLFSVSATTINPAAAISINTPVAAGPTAATILTAASGGSVTVQPSNLSGLAITTQTLPAGQLNVTYTQTLAATSGTAPYTWALLSGTLPRGLSVSAAGVISGKPTTAGTFAFVVQLTDNTKLARTQALVITVANAPVAAPTVENAASLGPLISPNTWFSIVGANLASTTRAAVDADTVGGVLPTTLNGVGVTVNGKPAAVSYVSPTQINALMPADVIPGPVQVGIVGGANIPAISVQVSPVSPAFFLWSPSYVAATHIDSSLAVKAGEFPNIVTVPAKPGEVIILLGTGFGPTTPATPVGQVVSANLTYHTLTRPTVTIGGTAAPVAISRLAAGQAGLYQIEVTVPLTAPNGDLPVVATVGGVASRTGVFLTVHK
jgi:uncharacterized protein (TIGR03437 family)